MEQIACGFLNAGVPATGLSPIINIWEKNGTKRITNGALQEIAGGFYIYNFNEYSPEKFYLYLIDGTDALADGDRYIMGNNELDAYSNKNTRGRTVAATVSYKPDFDKIHAGMQTLSTAKSLDLKPITKEIASIKKSLSLDTNLSKSELIDRIAILENNILSTTNDSKEELKSHIENITASQLETMINNVLEGYKNNNSAYGEMINGLSSSIKEKLDTLPSKAELSASGDKINTKLEEVIMTLAAGYIRDNITEMFDFSFKRKKREIPVQNEEEEILDLLTK